MHGATTSAWKLLGLLICISFLICRAAQPPPPVSRVSYRHPFRLIGTNLFDFTPIITEKLRPNPSPVAETYFLKGVIQRTHQEGVIILRDLGYGYRYEPRIDLETTDTMDLLQTMAANSIASKGEISLGHYLTMSPEMRRHFKQVRKTQEVLVRNCPSNLRRIGKPVELFAFPLGQVNVSPRQTNTQLIPCYDYGHAFTNDVPDDWSVTRVTTNGLVRVASKSEIALRASKIEENTVRWLRKRASEGSSASQFDLGLRYLNGNGTPMDQQLGIEWIRLAATNGNPQAVKFLKDYQTATPPADF